MFLFIDSASALRTLDAAAAPLQAAVDPFALFFGVGAALMLALIGYGLAPSGTRKPLPDAESASDPAER